MMDARLTRELHRGLVPFGQNSCALLFAHQNVVRKGNVGQGDCLFQQPHKLLCHSGYGCWPIQLGTKDQRTGEACRGLPEISLKIEFGLRVGSVFRRRVHKCHLSRLGLRILQ